MKKFLFLVALIMATSMGLTAQTCKVQGVVRYYYNNYIGFKPDVGAEVHFLKYSSKYKTPDKKKWDAYQDLVDNWIKYKKYIKVFDKKKTEEVSGFKREYNDSLQKLGGLLLIETAEYESKNVIKYSTVVDDSGKYSISVPYGIYYVWIKSKNRKLPTLLEYENRQRMIRVDLKSPTKIISYDFDVVQ